MPKAIVCIFCMMILMHETQGNKDDKHKGGEDPKEKGNKDDKHKGGEDPKEKGNKDDKHKGGEDPKEKKPKDGDKVKTMEGEDNNEEQKPLCFNKAKKNVFRILNVCKCDVYQRFQTYIGPDLSNILDGLKKIPQLPAPRKKGQKKPTCKPEGYVKKFFDMGKYGFLNVRTCFWQKQQLLNGTKPKWENLKQVLDNFEIEDDKKKNITDSITSCEENTGEDENDEETEEEEESYPDFSKYKFPEIKDPKDVKKLFDFFADLKTDFEKMQKQLERGGVDPGSFKIGRCIKEKIDAICGDFQQKRSEPKENVKSKKGEKNNGEEKEDKKHGKHQG